MDTQEKFAIPRADIREEDDKVILEVELPGVTRDGLDISVEDDELTITGKRSTAIKGMAPVYRERRPDNYRRSFILGNIIDKEKIEAGLEDGVLKLVLPRVPETRPRKIAIK